MANTTEAETRKLITHENKHSSSGCVFLPQFKHTLAPAFLRYDSHNNNNSNNSSNNNPLHETFVISSLPNYKQQHQKQPSDTGDHERNQWNQLPVDIILEIFSFVQLVVDIEVTTYHSLKSSLFGRFVIGIGDCNRVFTVVKALFSHLFVRNDKYPYDLQALERWLLKNVQFQHIKSIQTNCHGLYSARTIKLLVQRNANLQQFDRMTIPTIHELLGKEPILKLNWITHIHITGQNDMLERDNHMLGTYFRIEEPISTDLLIQKLLTGCPILESLCLESMQISAECLQPIKNHQTLRRLSLYGNFFGFTASHASLLQQCQTLREVDLSTWIILRDSCSKERHLIPWKILFSTLNTPTTHNLKQPSNIRTLHIHHSLTDSVLRFILHHGPVRLRVLNISDNSELTDDGFDMSMETPGLNNVVQLEQLIVSRCHKLTDRLVDLLNMYLPTITYLDISTCSGICNSFLFGSERRTVRQE